MKLPINGSLIANALLFLTGAVTGVTSYWTIDRFDLLAYFQDSELQVDDKLTYETHRKRSGNQATSRNSSYRGSEADHALRHSIEAHVIDASSERDPRLRAELLSRAGAEGARRNVEEALKLGHSLQRMQNKLDYFRGLYGVWSALDPESALNYAKQNFTAGLLQSELVSLALNRWGSTDAQQAWLWTELNLSGPLRNQAMTDMMIGWTRRNPEIASNWLAQSGTATSSMISAVGTTWAEQNPEAAAYWASSLLTSAARRTASLAVVNEWTRQDPETAAKFFEEQTLENDNVDLATVIADVWGTSDPAAASVWISELPSGPVKNQAAGTLATVWATRDIEAAVAWSESIEDPGMRSQVISHLATTWGALEPDKAIGWLTELSPELAEAGMTGALNSWAAVDPVGMWDWVESAESSVFVDKARRSLADVRSQDDILDSIDLALGISSAEERNDAVARYFRQWRKKDEASAQEWIREYWNVIPKDLQVRLDKEQTGN